MRDAISRNQHAFPEGRAGKHAKKKSTNQKWPKPPRRSASMQQKPPPKWRIVSSNGPLRTAERRTLNPSGRSEAKCRWRRCA